MDLALAAGIMGWPITDNRFPRALDVAARSGIDLGFGVARIPRADHPNTVRILARSEGGARITATAKSTGGGGILFTEIDGRPVRIDASRDETIVVAAPAAGRRIGRIMTSAGADVEPPRRGAASAVRSSSG